MSAYREQLIEALVTAVNTGMPTGVPATERERTETMQVEDLPRSVVYPHTEQIEHLGSGLGRTVRRSFAVALEATAAAAPGHRASEAVDVILAWYSTALGNSHLGGLALSVRENEIKWASDVGQLPVARATAIYVITYTTRVNDATLKT